jgi:predicted MPP superfamily phosphohydrolase
MIESGLLVRVLFLALYLAAAWCVFIYLLNRYLMPIRKSSPKMVIIVLSFAGLTLAALAFGLMLDALIWLLPPAVIVVIAIIGEVRLILDRRRDAGELPVEREAAPLSWTRPLTTTDVAFARYEMDAPGWNGPDLRIAHISDLHLSDRVPLAYFCAAIERARHADPDLVFFTGDFLSKGHGVELIPPILSAIRGRLGTYAILGNHDYWVDELEVSEAVRQAGVTLLDDRCKRLELADGSALMICGCQSPWSGPNLALPRPRDGELGLILSHTADNIAQLSGPGVAAVFSGHFHAGQLRVPGLGSLVVPSGYGRRFDHGHFVVNGTHLFVTSGLGSETPPVRLYCQPDIFIVDLKGMGSNGRPGDDHRG